MCNSGGTSTTTTTIPPELLAAYQGVVGAASNFYGNTQPQAYSNNPNAFVASLTPTQEAGIGNINAAAGQAQPYYGQATTSLAQGQQGANALQAQGLGSMMRGYGQAQGYNAAATGDVTQGQQYGRQLNEMALRSACGAYSGAQPYNAQAGTLYGQALSAGNPYIQGATNLITGAISPVCAQQIGGCQIGQFQTPYMQSVLQGEEGILNQQNQQAQSGQLGNAITSGAYGGCRAGIAAANLDQQQRLANSQIYSGILNQGYSQALAAAQQQQGVNLGAAQANRTAQQEGVNQLLGIGQQVYGQTSCTGKNLQGLGQAMYGQGMGLSQQQAAIGQQQFGQCMAASGQMLNIGQQDYTQGMGLGQAQAALGQQVYGQGVTDAQTLASLGTGAQTAAIQGGQAQMGAGQAQQQTQQAENQAMYNQWMQTNYGLPMQLLNTYAGSIEGIGQNMGSTATTQKSPGIFCLLATGGRVGRDAGGRIGKCYGGGLGGICFNAATNGYTPGTGPAMGANSPLKASVYCGGSYAGQCYGASLFRPAYPTAYAAPSFGGMCGYGSGLGGYAGYGSRLGYGPPQAAGKGPQPGYGQPQQQPQPQQSSGPQFATPSGISQPAAPQASGKGPSAPQASGKGPQARGGFASGGSVSSMGGLVSPFSERQGFAEGGPPFGVYDPNSMTSMLSAQQGMFNGAGPTAFPSYTPVTPPRPPATERASTPRADDSQPNGIAKAVQDKIGGVGKDALDKGWSTYIQPHISDAMSAMGLGPSGAAKSVDAAAEGTDALVGMADAGLPAAADAACAAAAPEAIDAVIPFIPFFSTGGSARKRRASGGGLGDLNAGTDQSEDEDDSDSNDDDGSLSGVGPLSDSLRSLISPPASQKLGAPSSSGLGALVASPPPAQVAPPANSVMAMIKGAEGAGKNPLSSAVGPYQFVNKTFVNEFRKLFPQRAQGMQDSDIVALRKTPEGAQLSEKMAPALAQENIAALKQSDLPVTPGNIYLTWLLGPHYGVKTLQSRPDTPMASIVPHSFIDANKAVLAGKTAAEVARWTADRLAAHRAARASPGLGAAAFATGGVVRAGVADGGTSSTGDDNLDAETGASRLPAPPAASPAASQDDGSQGDWPDLNVQAPPPTGTAAAPPPATGLGGASFVPGSKEDEAAASKKAADGSMVGAVENFGSNAWKGLKAGLGGYGAGLAAGNEKQWMPLLTGLVGAAAGSRQGLGNALGMGAASGIGQYGKQMAFEQKGQEVQAETEKAKASTTQANAAVLNAQNERLKFITGLASKFIPVGKGMYTDVLNLTGKGANGLVTQKDVQEYMRKQADLLPTGFSPYVDTANAPQGGASASPPSAPSSDQETPAASGSDDSTPAPTAPTAPANLVGASAINAANSDPQVVQFEGERQRAQDAADNARKLMADPDIMANPDAYRHAEALSITSQAAANAAQARKQERISSLAGASVSLASTSATGNYNSNLQAKNDILATATSMPDLIRDAVTQLRALKDPKTGRYNINGGPLGPQITNLSGFLRQAGLSDEAVEAITGTDPVKAAEFAKIAPSLATRMGIESMNGRPYAGQFKSFMNTATPNDSLPAMASDFILNKYILPKAEVKRVLGQVVGKMDPAKDNIQAAALAFERSITDLGDISDQATPEGKKRYNAIMGRAILNARNAARAGQ